MRTNYRSLLVVLCLLFMFVSCSKQETEPGKKSSGSLSSGSLEERTPDTPASKDGALLANWDGGSISLEQIDEIILPAMASIIKSTSGDMVDRLALERKSRLDTLIDNHILILEALRLNLSLTPPERDAILRKLRSNYETKEEYEAQLERYAKDENSILSVLENIQLGGKCVTQQGEKLKSTITLNILKKHYDSIASGMFTPPARTKINNVELWPNEDRSLDESKALAEKLRIEVAEGIQSVHEAIASVTTPEALFKSKRRVIQRCAEKNSDSPEAGYNFGFLTIYQSKDFNEFYAKEFLSAILKYEVGEVSDVVRTKNGYGFFFVLEQIPSHVIPFESDNVQKMLPHIYLAAKMEEWKESLKERYHLNVYDDALRLPFAFEDRLKEILAKSYFSSTQSFLSDKKPTLR